MNTNFPSDVEAIAAHAREIRRDVIRMIAPRGQGYVAQGLGAADIFAALYFGVLRLDPAYPAWPGRDRFILSTAHNSAVFYATLVARGLLSSASMRDYCADGSPLEINVSERLGPLVEATCGSLGQGLSVAVGMALSARRRAQNHRIYVLLGDGELQEGQLWEAALSAANFDLDNLCLIIDRNYMQVEGHTDHVQRLEPLIAKWQSFGWFTAEIDGHDISAILASLESSASTKKRPSVIIAKTIVGKGVPFLEGQLSHNLKLPPDVAERALQSLEHPA